MGLTFWKRKSYPTNLLFLAGFTAFEAFAISIIVSFYNASIVLQALIITGGLFIGLTIFACQTKYDFSNWAPYLFGSLWALILFGFVAMFFPAGQTTDLIWGGLGALVFSGYVLFDTQMIMRRYHVEEEIAASIALYLDLINLFLSILRILNSRE
jgi:FtsH-binding integral membrane protein